MLVNKLEVNNPILITDLWNELNTSWPISSDLYTEIDPKMVETPSRKGLNAISCSITNLPMEEEVFQQLSIFQQLIIKETPYLP